MHAGHKLKVAFVLVAHLPDDERIRFQEAQSLQEEGHEICIVSTRTNNSSNATNYCFDDTGMPKRKLIKKLSSILSTITPDVTICDNPIAILAAQLYKKNFNNSVRIIYDITEWYPSKKNLRRKPLLQKGIKLFSLIFLSLYTARFLNGFIFGEYYKGKPFRLFFPRKRYVYLSYYADPVQVKTYPVKDISKHCTFFYAGNLTKEKGFEDVLNVAKACAFRFPATQFILHILSKDCCYEFNATSYPENMKIKTNSPLPFLSFCEEIGKADFFFDLRKIDMENTHCLPIKLFYYMATGRPVIYSDLKAIRKEVKEISKIGILVNPKDTDTIISYIDRCIKNNDYYQNQCKYARQLAVQKYNWAKIKHRFTEFVQHC
jgi:glycosyltransferase involved in cell wall biosynthesis